MCASPIIKRAVNGKPKSIEDAAGMWLRRDLPLCHSLLPHHGVWPDTTAGGRVRRWGRTLGGATGMGAVEHVAGLAALLDEHAGIPHPRFVHCASVMSTDQHANITIITNC